MALTLFLALQAAAAPAPAAPSADAGGAQRWTMADPGSFRDIGARRDEAPSAFPAGTCLGAVGADVLVCGRRRGGGAPPIERWARMFGPEAPIRAEVGLGGGVTGLAYTEAAAMPRGATAKRVMVGIRLPF
jgi:hypothetical protein